VAAFIVSFLAQPWAYIGIGMVLFWIDLAKAFTIIICVVHTKLNQKESEI
jgi:hypothetical protein